ncbi:TIGR00282 family metallophosphoesterase [Chloroflexota bacterium]
MNILVIGDIVGRPGRHAVKELLPGLISELKLDWIIANGENAAGGFGLTLDTAEELFAAGCNTLTSGNHIWTHKSFIQHLDSDMPVIRPLNYPDGVPGRGYIIRSGIMVVNLIGRTFMNSLDCPFRAIDALLEATKDERPPVIIIDFHAEATSEKMAMGWYLNGRVSAVLGTHTHVGTVDTRVLPKGTAYVSDIGMTGPMDTVIGDKKEAVINRFLYGLPHHLSVGNGRVLFSAVMVKISPETGQALQIERIDRTLEE